MCLHELFKTSALLFESNPIKTWNCKGIQSLVSHVVHGDKFITNNNVRYFQWKIRISLISHILSLKIVHYFCSTSKMKIICHIKLINWFVKKYFWWYLSSINLEWCYPGLKMICSVWEIVRFSKNAEKICWREN